MSVSIIPTVNPVYAERLSRRRSSDHSELWDLLDLVYDPEMPGVSIWELGILQQVHYQPPQVVVVITPTYSGCPAVDTIRDDVVHCLQQAGYQQVQVKVALAPAWETDMISPQGRRKMLQLQIAPPTDEEHQAVACPLCASTDTQVISQFGSTACKALYQCNHCLETFDHFKKL